MKHKENGIEKVNTSETYKNGFEAGIKKAINIAVTSNYHRAVDCGMCLFVKRLEKELKR